MVKAKRNELGYTLSYGGKSAEAVRRPDLYFDLELDGVKHKGYLKGLKDIFFAWAEGNPVQAQGKPAKAGVREVEEEPAGRGGGGRRPEPKDLDATELAQFRIHAAETTHEAVAAYVAAYNLETVAVSMGKKPRHQFELPHTPKIDPPLKACYDPVRDQYTWPNLHNPEPKSDE
jgi:hypothetical protein